MRYAKKLILSVAISLVVIGAGLALYLLLPTHFTVTVTNTASIPLEEVTVIAGRHRESIRNIQPGQRVVLEFRAAHEGSAEVQGKVRAQETLPSYCGAYIDTFVLEIEYEVQWYGERSIQMDCRETRRVSKF